MRDPEMVKHAHDVFLSWTRNRSLGDLSGAEMLADFAADEVARALARAEDSMEGLRIRLKGVEAQRDAALASRSKAEDLVIAARKAEAEQRSRAEKAEARASKAEAERDARVSRANFDILAQQRCDAMDRAFKAEARADRAEARVRELEAKLPAPPYTPRVGDVCVVTVNRACDSTLMRGDVVTITGEVGVGSLWVRKSGGESWLVGPNKIRPATPAERAAAGLPPEPAEAPDLAALRAAVVDAEAAWRVAGDAQPYCESDYETAIGAYSRACAALVAAVARRDGGAK